MTKHCGQAISWEMNDGWIELSLQHEPLNEIGSLSLGELEEFVEELEVATGNSSALIIYSTLPQGFSSGADLRELYEKGRSMPLEERVMGVRQFLERIHRVLNIIDASPLTTIAAVHGVCFGGGFELALACDLIIADKMSRFCFPELRLGLIPGFGGIPRLKRDLGNAVIRDLLLTGRSFNVQRAHDAGLVSQMAAEGAALRVARATAAQIAKFDRHTSVTAKQFIKPIPYNELRREIEIFCTLFARPAVEDALRKHAERTDRQPYLP